LIGKPKAFDVKKLLDLKREIPRYVPASQAWIETILVTGGAFLMGWGLSPGDPFFVKASFPWPLLAPLLSGLRHGVAGGAGSAVLLVFAMAMTWRGGHASVATFPLQLSLAYLVIGILAGEFANMWRRRTQRLVTRLEYHRARLEEFTRTYHVLKESFDVLNRKNLTDPHNLREALFTFRKGLASSEVTGDPFLGLSDTILSLFADFAQLHAAVLYAVSEEGEVAGEHAAALGTDRRVTMDDPLIRATLTKKQPHNVVADFRGREQETPWLVAVPLVDVTDRVHGILAVENMLFSSFQGTVLSRLAVLGGHVGDLLAFRGPTHVEDDFRRRVERARLDAKRFGLESSAVCVRAGKDRAYKGWFRALLEKRRGLDGAYHVKHDKHGDCVFLLLPMTDEQGLAGYRARLAKLLIEHGITEAEAPLVEDFPLREEGDFQALLDRLDKPFEAPGAKRA
jgi:hypothetical protein